MKSVFAGVSAVALAVASAAGVASALNANQPNNAPATNQAQQPVYRCESLGIDHIASDSYKFSVKYAAYNGATYKGTVYRVYDANGKEVYNTAGAKFNGFEPGNYTAKAFVTVSVNGKDETVTSDGCTKTFTIKAAQNDQNNKPDKPSEPTPQPQEPSKPANPDQNKPGDQKPTPQQPSKPDNQNKPNNPNHRLLPNQQSRLSQLHLPSRASPTQSRTHLIHRLHHQSQRLQLIQHLQTNSPRQQPPQILTPRLPQRLHKQTQPTARLTTLARQTNYQKLVSAN